MGQQLNIGRLNQTTHPSTGPRIVNQETSSLPRVATGSAGLDHAIKGLPKNEYALLTGAEATGKSIFCLQFLLAGLQAGERGVLVTSLPAESNLEMADALEFPLREAVAANNLIILHQETQVPDILKSREDLEQMTDVLEAEILPWEPTRMVIDSALPFINLFHPEFRKSGLLKVLRGFGAMGLTTLITTRMPATSEAMSLKKTLEENSGCSLHFDEQCRTDGETQRRLACRKVKGVPPPYPVFDFAIENGVGLQIGDPSKTRLSSPAEEVKLKQEPKAPRRSLFAAAARAQKSNQPPAAKETAKPQAPEEKAKSASHPPKSAVSFIPPQKKR